MVRETWEEVERKLKNFIDEKRGLCEVGKKLKNKKRGQWDRRKNVKTK
jgi:hypothetical protein